MRRLGGLGQPYPSSIGKTPKLDFIHLLKPRTHRLEAISSNTSDFFNIAQIDDNKKSLVYLDEIPTEPRSLQESFG